MGTTAHLWIEDSQGSWVKGNSQILSREHSIELLSIEHHLHSSFDTDNGQSTSPRKHSPFTIMKKLDQSTPFLNKACCNGERLSKAEILLYRINESGHEEPYFRYLFQNLKVASVTPLIHCSIDAADCERISLIYKTIRWEYIDGNYAHEDDWNQR